MAVAEGNSASSRGPITDLGARRESKAEETRSDGANGECEAGCEDGVVVVKREERAVMGGKHFTRRGEATVGMAAPWAPGDAS